VTLPIKHKHRTPPGSANSKLFARANHILRSKRETSKPIEREAVTHNPQPKAPSKKKNEKILQSEDIGFKRIITSAEEHTILDICTNLSDEDVSLNNILSYLDHLANVLPDDGKGLSILQLDLMGWIADLSMFFFDRGGVSILIDLLRKMTHNIDVAFRICKLLRTIFLDRGICYLEHFILV
jgi:hypothetical protein